LKSFILLFIICSSQVFTLGRKSSRNHSSKSTFTKRKGDLKHLNVIKFLIAFCENSGISYLAKFGEFLASITGNDPPQTNPKLKPCTIAAIEHTYNHQISKEASDVTANIEEAEAEERSLKHIYDDSTLYMKSSEKETLLGLTENPKDYCKKLKDVIESIIKFLKEMEDKINEGKSKQWNANDWISECNSIFQWDSTKSVCKDLKDKIHEDDGQNKVDHALVKEFLETHAILKKYKHNYHHVEGDNCDQYQEKIGNDHQKVGLASKVLAAYAVFEYVKTNCPSQYPIMSELITLAVKKIVGIIANLLGGFALKFIKVVVYAAKAVYNVYEAWKATDDVDTASTYWGTAAGIGFNVIRSSSDPSAKKRKKRRFMKLRK